LTTTHERPAEGLKGMYRDVLRGPDGEVRWDRGWTNNAIVGDCRRTLAGLLALTPGTGGIKGLWVGAGLAAWDASAPPPPTPAQTALVDPTPFLVPNPGPAFQIDFLDGGTPTATPTNRLQIKVTLGANVPPWPHLPDHSTSALREFGLVARLNGADVLLNYVTHLVINKDPASTLERTIWLVF